MLFAGWTLGLSLLFAVTGSSGEGTAALAGAVAYWSAHIGLGLLVLAAVTRFALRFAGFARLSVRVQLLVSGVAGAVAFTPVALALEGLMGLVSGPWPAAAGAGAAGFGADGAGIGAVAMLLVEEFGSLVAPFVGTWLLINLSCLAGRPGRGAQREQRQMTVAPAAKAAKAAESPKVPEVAAREGLLGRLKPALGTDVLALRAELNYLHVFTSRGQGMVVYSLARAAAELGDRGIQVHRSWWVARHAVARVRRTGSGLRCVLVNGQEVPVSRRRQKALLDEFGSDFQRAAAPEGAADQGAAQGR